MPLSVWPPVCEVSASLLVYSRVFLAVGMSNRGCFCPLLSALLSALSLAFCLLSLTPCQDRYAAFTLIESIPAQSSRVKCIISAVPLIIQPAACPMLAHHPRQISFCLLAPCICRNFNPLVQRKCDGTWRFVPPPAPRAPCVWRPGDPLSAKAPPLCSGSSAAPTPLTPPETCCRGYLGVLRTPIELQRPRH